ncbi:hypothetical protein COV17_03565 [Candidatus Woesearchaeota archaeon CG10_big_fil_rev_8_21_14_0_10_36_11]|nr:MAG: hypothetical protein COV17_03565 [Candidatus Woesearchaeota archaeon CG10_big_fil_rev_8_21_14_0_10_36_11]
MNTVVIIPAYNEEKTLRNVIHAVKKYVQDIIIVDDGSHDTTEQIVQEENVIFLKHAVNLGKGAALKTGCDYAITQNVHNIIVMDADGQHDPEKIPEFIEKLNNVNLVFGYRTLGTSMPFVLRFGNAFINKTTKILYGITVKDTQCGYRAFTAETYKKIRWNASDYSMESEMIARAGKHKVSYAQIPIQTIYADKYKGTTVLDGVSIVMKMFLWRFFK